jgi:hypothetical protein
MHCKHLKRKGKKEISRKKYMNLFREIDTCRLSSVGKGVEKAGDKTSHLA